MAKLKLSSRAKHFKAGPARRKNSNAYEKELAQKEVRLAKKEAEIARRLAAYEKNKSSFFESMLARMSYPGDNGPKKKKKKKSLFKRIFLFFITLAIWGGIAGIALLAYFSLDMPRLEDVIAEERSPSVRVLDRNGELITSIDDVYGQAIDAKVLPKHVWQAVLAIEDRRFFDHFGVDPIGVARALYINWQSKGARQGASTITQQAAKNIFLTRAKTIKRKVQELMLAVWMEVKFDKWQILNLYLNRINIAQDKKGLNNATLYYFGKPANKINIAESAIIAAMLKTPTSYNPITRPEASIKRRNLVISSMVEAGFITEAQAAEAKKYKYTRPNRAGSSSRYFADFVMDELDSRVGDANEDINVYTTLDLKMQTSTESILKKHLETDGKEAKASQGAALFIDTNGGIRTMIGGRDYVASQFNRTTQSLRQPGSAFKPFVFAASLEKGYTPESIVVDEPIDVGGYAPKNLGGKYQGQVTLRHALAQSINTTPLYLARDIGIDAVINTARKVGLIDKINRDFSIVLGSSAVRMIDLVAAYGVFANKGYGIIPYSIERVKTASGNVLYERHPSDKEPLFSEKVIYGMDDMMRSVISNGTGKRANLGIGTAGKTGTSQNNVDAWFIGYYGNIVGGVWLGNDDNSPMGEKTYGGALPAQIWGESMRSVFK